VFALTLTMHAWSSTRAFSRAWELP
jgi:hypothetical protein